MAQQPAQTSTILGRFNPTAPFSGTCRGVSTGTREWATTIDPCDTIQWENGVSYLGETPAGEGDDMLRRLIAHLGRHPDRGATAVEYALMVTMIAVVIIGAVMALGLNLIPFFTDAANGI